MQTKTETAAAPAPVVATINPRLCIKPGCNAELGLQNKSGRCATHFHWNPKAASKTHLAKPNGANGHAHAAHVADSKTETAKGNGTYGLAKNPDASPLFIGDFREDRLNQLLLNFCRATKADLAARWLRGEI